MEERTKSRAKLLLYCFEQGFFTETQAGLIAGVCPNELRELVVEGYLESEKSYFDDLLLYFSSKKAQEFPAQQGIKVYVDWLKRPPVKNELHDRRLTDIRIVLEKMGYPDWQSERRLHQRGMRKVTPDAILEVGRPKLAIELELTGKGERRYEKKFRFYSAHPSIDAVLYFVSTPEIKEKLLSYAKSYPKIHVVLLRDFMQCKQNENVEAAERGDGLNLQEFLEKIEEVGFRVRRAQWRKNNLSSNEEVEV